MQTYLLYHDDSDGHAAAAAFRYVKAKQIEKQFNLPVVYIPVQYGQEFPEQVILSKKSAVWIVDFSYSREILDELHEKLGFIMILDHHESAQEQLFGRPYAVFDQGKSGATLAWEYFNPGIKIPYLFKLIEDRDLWRKQYQESSWLEAGIHYSGMAKQLLYWDLLLIDEVEFKRILEVGQVLTTNNEGIVNSFVHSDKYAITEYANKKIAFYNTTGLISEIAEGLYTDKELDIDMTMSYFVTGNGQVVFNFRSQKEGKNTNCQEFARSIPNMITGGGHRNSAGCVLSLHDGFELIKEIMGSIKN